MAKNASTVEHFLEDLARKTIVTAHHDYLESQSIKRQYLGDPAAKLYPWDMAFFGKILM